VVPSHVIADSGLSSADFQNQLLRETVGKEAIVIRQFKAVLMGINLQGYLAWFSVASNDGLRCFCL